MAMIIGITGLIASGKTTMCDYLEKMNYKVFESDVVVKKLYQNKAFLAKIKEIFPEVFANGGFDKKLLTRIIFSNKDKKIKLESLVHPLVNIECDKFIEENKNEKIIFLESSLLFETGWDKKCNKTILIKIKKDIQRDRYIIREGSEEMFEEILSNQNCSNSKIKKANFVIENNYSIDTFYKNIDGILKS